MASRHTSIASGSPASTASAQAAASASGSPLAAAQARETAPAEASVSRQPYCPQPHFGPPGRTTMCPISPAYPCAPASIRPSMPMAPAMPVPSGRKRKRSAPLPAPIRPSASPCGPYVVPERDRHTAQPLGQQRPQRDVPPAEVGGVHGDAAHVVDDAGHGQARSAGGLAVRAQAVVAQLGGEVEDGGDHGVGTAVPAGGAARLVQQRAVLRDQGGLHPGAAHIEGDDMSHGDSVAVKPLKGLVHFTG